MNCRKVNSILSAYIDGELTGAERLQIRQHLRVCPGCQEEYESLLLTKRLLSGLATKAPCRDLEKVILRRIGEEGKPRRTRFSGRAWWFLLSPTQRLRVATLCAVFSLACFLLTAAPFASHRRTIDKPINLLSPPPMSASFRIPTRDHLLLHDAYEDSQPLSNGPIITPNTPITPAGLYNLKEDSR